MGELLPLAHTLAHWDGEGGEEEDFPSSNMAADMTDMPVRHEHLCLSLYYYLAFPPQAGILEPLGKLLALAYCRGTST